MAKIKFEDAILVMEKGDVFKFDYGAIKRTGVDIVWLDNGDGTPSVLAAEIKDHAGEFGEIISDPDVIAAKESLKMGKNMPPHLQAAYSLGYEDGKLERDLKYIKMMETAHAYLNSAKLNIDMHSIENESESANHLNEEKVGGNE